MTLTCLLTPQRFVAERNHAARSGTRLRSVAGQRHPLGARHPQHLPHEDAGERYAFARGSFAFTGQDYGRPQAVHLLQQVRRWSAHGRCHAVLTETLVGVCFYSSCCHIILVLPAFLTKRDRPRSTVCKGKQEKYAISRDMWVWGVDTTCW